MGGYSTGTARNVSQKFSMSALAEITSSRITTENKGVYRDASGLASVRATLGIQGHAPSICKGFRTGSSARSFSVCVNIVPGLCVTSASQIADSASTLVLKRRAEAITSSMESSVECASLS
jgi:hypothetical protein